TLQVFGSSFVNGMVVRWNGTPLTTTFVSTTQLNAAVSAVLLASPATVNVTVAVADGAVSAARQLVVYAPLQITTTFIPSTTATFNYSIQLAGAGGVPPYTWSASGLPGGLSLNPSTGVISGAATSDGNFSVMVTLKDAIQQVVSATFSMRVLRFVA